MNTDEMRRAMVQSGQPYAELEEARSKHEQTWQTDEMRRDFEVLGFAAPYVVVRRKSDSKRGTLEFTHNPRVYFGWQEDTP